MVAPAGASLPGAGAGAPGVLELSLNATLPKVIVSPIATVQLSTRWPLWNVPLLDPRSRTCTPFSFVVTSACRREMVGSNTGISLVGARPTTIGVPALSSNVCRLSALVSLKRMSGVEYETARAFCLVSARSALRPGRVRARLP